MVTSTARIAKRQMMSSVGQRGRVACSVDDPRKLGVMSLF